jgi:hypothetical protein
MSETSWGWDDVPGHALVNAPRNKAERRELVISLRKQGTPIGNISRMLGISRNAVVSDLHSAAPAPAPEPKTHPEFRSLGHHNAWTPQRDNAVLRMLEADVPIAEIARHLGVGDTALRRRIGIIAPDWRPACSAGAPPTPIKAKKPEKTVEIRQALPAGSPVSWGAITAGTCLEGLAWPGADAG